MEREHQARRQAQSRAQQRGVRPFARHSLAPQNDHDNEEMENSPLRSYPPPHRPASDRTEGTSASYSTSSLASASTSTQTSVGSDPDSHLSSRIQESSSSQTRLYTQREDRIRGSVMDEHRNLPQLPTAQGLLYTRNIVPQTVGVAGSSRLSPLSPQSPGFSRSRLPVVQHEDTLYDVVGTDFLYSPHTPARLQGPGIPGSRSSRIQSRYRSTRPTGHRSVTEPTALSSSMLARGYGHAEDIHSQSYAESDRVGMSDSFRGIGGRPRARVSNVRGSGGGNRGRYMESSRDQEQEYDPGEQDASVFEYEGGWERDKNRERSERFVTAPVTPIAVSAVSTSPTSYTRTFNEQDSEGEDDRMARRGYNTSIRGRGDERSSGSYASRVDPSAPLAHSSSPQGYVPVYGRHRLANRPSDSQSSSRSRSPDSYPRLPSRGTARFGGEGRRGRSLLRTRPASAPLTSLESQASSSPGVSSYPGHGSSSVDVEGDIEMRASESDAPPPPSSISPASTAPPLPSASLSEGDRHQQGESTAITGSASQRSGNVSSTNAGRASASAGTGERAGAGTGQSDRRSTDTSATGTRVQFDTPRSSNSHARTVENSGEKPQTETRTPARGDRERRNDTDDTRGRRRSRPSSPPSARVRRSASAGASVPEFVEGSSRVAERGHYPPRSTYPASPVPQDSRYDPRLYQRDDRRTQYISQYTIVPSPIQPSGPPYVYSYSPSAPPSHQGTTLPPIGIGPRDAHVALAPPTDLLDLARHRNDPIDPSLRSISPEPSSASTSQRYTRPVRAPAAGEERSQRRITEPYKQPPASPRSLAARRLPPTDYYTVPPYVPHYVPHPPPSDRDYPQYGAAPASFGPRFDYYPNQMSETSAGRPSYGGYEPGYPRAYYPTDPGWEPPMSSMHPPRGEVSSTSSRRQQSSGATLSPTLLTLVNAADQERARIHNISSDNSHRDRDRDVEMIAGEDIRYAERVVSRRVTEPVSSSVYASGRNIKDDETVDDDGVPTSKKGRVPSRGGRGARGRSASSKSRSASRIRGGKSASGSSSTPRRSSKGKEQEKASPTEKFSELETNSTEPSRKRARVEHSNAPATDVRESKLGEGGEEPASSPKGRRASRGRGATSRSRKGKEKESSGEDGVRHRRVTGKVVLACDYCRGRKMKCDGEKPKCGTCASKGKDCVYNPLGPRRRGPGKKLKKGQAAASATEGESSAAGPSTGRMGDSSRTQSGQYSSHGQFTSGREYESAAMLDEEGYEYGHYGGPAGGPPMGSFPHLSGGPPPVGHYEPYPPDDRQHYMHLEQMPPPGLVHPGGGRIWSDAPYDPSHSQHVYGEGHVPHASANPRVRYPAPPGHGAPQPGRSISTSAVPTLHGIGPSTSQGTFGAPQGTPYQTSPHSAYSEKRKAYEQGDDEDDEGEYDEDEPEDDGDEFDEDDEEDDEDDDDEYRPSRSSSSRRRQ